MEEKLCVSCEEPVVDKQPPCPLSCMSPKCKAYQNNRVINVNKKPIIWIFGGPGSGKSTQCMRIAKKYEFTHVCTGDIVRAEAASTSDKAKCLTTVLARGGLAPTDIVLDIVKDAMLKTMHSTKGFIIDGYPCDRHQGIVFEKTIAIPSVILYLEASPDNLLKRSMESKNKSSPIDDTEDTIKMRIQTFLSNVPDILNRYKIKLKRINADASPDEIFSQVTKIIDPIVEKAKTANISTVPKLPTSIELP